MTENSIVNSMLKVLPIIKDVFPEYQSFTLADKEKFLYIYTQEKIKSTVSAGG